MPSPVKPWLPSTDHLDPPPSLSTLHGLEPPRSTSQSHYHQWESTLVPAALTSTCNSNSDFSQNTLGQPYTTPLPYFASHASQDLFQNWPDFPLDLDHVCWQLPPLSYQAQETVDLLGDSQLTGEDGKTPNATPDSSTVNFAINDEPHSHSSLQNSSTQPSPISHPLSDCLPSSHTPSSQTQPSSEAIPTSSSSSIVTSRIEKRIKNTQAARRYRQRRVDQVNDLELALKEMQKERDELKVRVARLEGEAEVMRQLLRVRK